MPICYLLRHAPLVLTKLLWGMLKPTLLANSIQTMREALKEAELKHPAGLDEQAAFVHGWRKWLQLCEAARTPASTWERLLALRAQAPPLRRTMPEAET